MEATSFETITLVITFFARIFSIGILRFTVIWVADKEMRDVCYQTNEQEMDINN